MTNVVVVIAAVALVGLLIYRFKFQKKEEAPKKPAPGKNWPGVKPTHRR